MILFFVIDKFLSETINEMIHSQYIFDIIFSESSSMKNTIKFFLSPKYVRASSPLRTNGCMALKFFF